MVENLYPKDCLALADFRTKTILIATEPTGPDLPKRERARLVELGELCIKTTQTLGNEHTRKGLEQLGAKNFGQSEYPIYDTDAHWFFGVIGGLEIYATQLCDGPRIAQVTSNEEDVFKYDSDDVNRTTGEVDNPKILTYVPGEWEKRIYELGKAADEKRKQKIIML